MKMKRGKAILLGVFLLAGFLSCNKENSTTPEQNDVVSRYLEFKTKMNAFSGSKGQMSNFLNVIGASQMNGRFFKMKALKGDAIKTDSVTPGDSTGYWGYWTCAEVTEFDNNDGTHTTIYDYGDGCDDYGSLTKGRITYIWSNEGENYYSKVLYEHYYSWGMEMNGFSEYSFVSDGNSHFEYDSTGFFGDSANYVGVCFYWTGTASGHDTMTLDYDTGEKYRYTSNFSNKWDQNSYTVLEGDYSYESQPDGYFYQYQVTVPLVTNYECINTWVPVSGVEAIHYNDLKEAYDFEIDYGSGTCDNLATITENGESSEIDFGELMIFYCGTDSITSSNGSRK